MENALLSVRELHGTLGTNAGPCFQENLVAMLWAAHENDEKPNTYYI